MRNLIVFIAALIMFSGCAFHSGTIGQLSPTEPVFYEDIAIGVATSNHFLGLGGVKKDVLLFDAKRNLMSNHLLDSGEFYGAFTVDVKRSFYLLGYKTKITVMADILRPIEGNTSNVYSSQYLSKINVAPNVFSIYSIGDSICTAETHRFGIIQSFTDLDTYPRARVVFIDSTKNTRIKTLSFDRIYVLKDFQNCVYKIGDDFDGKTVIGIGKNGLLLRKKNGKVRIKNLETIFKPAT